MGRDCSPAAPLPNYLRDFRISVRMKSMNAFGLSTVSHVLGAKPFERRETCPAGLPRHDAWLVVSVFAYQDRRSSGFSSSESFATPAGRLSIPWQTTLAGIGASDSRSSAPSVRSVAVERINHQRSGDSSSCGNGVVGRRLLCKATATVAATRNAANPVIVSFLSFTDKSPSRRGCSTL